MSIEVGKYEVFGMPPYFFFSLFGGTVSICCYLILLLISKVEVSKKNLFLCIFAIVGVLIGARVFGVLTNIAIALYNNKKIGLDVIYKAGLVYYGGLIGGVLFYYIGLRILFKKNYDINLVNSYAASIPLFHVFGRLGCLFAGCCYGKEYHGYGHINYVRDGISTETLPIQLLESFMEFGIFCFLLILFCKNKKKTNILYIYFLMYSVGRFIIEFFRGDEYRGDFGVLSFSQIISILVFIINIFLCLRRSRENESY